MDSSNGWHKIPGISGVATTASINVAAACTVGQVLVTSGLSVTPTSGNTAQRYTATFTITNNTCGDFAPTVLTAGGRGPNGDSDVQDFDQKHNIVVAPGQTYTYTAGRTFDHPGTYNFWVTWMDANNGWHNLSGAPGVATTASISLTAAPSAAHPVVSSLTVSPAQPMLGQPVTVTYTITNTGGTDWGPIWPSLGVGGPGWPNIDFPDGPLTTVAKNGGQYTYSETKTFTGPGTFTFTPGYRDGTTRVWYQLYDASGNSVAMTFSMNNCVANPVVTRSLAVGPAHPLVGNQFLVTFTISNTGCADFPRTPSASRRAVRTDRTRTSVGGTEWWSIRMRATRIARSRHPTSSALTQCGSTTR